MACRQAEAVLALYGDFYILVHKTFSCRYPSWKVQSAAIPQNLTALLPKGQPGRCGKNKPLFASVRLKAIQLLGAITSTELHQWDLPVHPAVLGSVAGRRGLRETGASLLRLKEGLQS